MKNIILEINNLNVEFTLLDKSKVYAVNDVSINLLPKETLAVVGESGSGKTQFSLSIIRLLAKNAKISGEINFDGKNILDLDTNELNKIRGNKISMIFQDPMTSLNPYLKISTQMTEILTEKQGLNYNQAIEKSIEMLDLVNIPDAKKRIDSYPHQFSGGMRQRIMIAMALLTNPSILLADEPTTALDVTIQSQILDILQELKGKIGVSTIIVTHDLGVVSTIADKIAVFYAGKVVEYGTKEEIFTNPKHPYTQALLQAIPRFDQNKNEKLFVIEGMPSVVKEKPKQCSFALRCKYVQDICRAKVPEVTKSNTNHKFMCFHPHDM